MLCARIGTGNTYRVFCMVTELNPTHFDRLTNLVHYRSEPLSFVRTVVLQLYRLIQWHGHGRLLYIHVLGVAGTRL